MLNTNYAASNMTHTLLKLYQLVVLLWLGLLGSIIMIFINIDIIHDLSIISYNQ